MRIKSSSFTHHYIQVQTGGLPEVIFHNSSGIEWKFLSKKDAENYLQHLKSENPNEKYRLVTLTQSYKIRFWQ